MNLKTKTIFTESGADFKEMIEFKDLELHQKQDVKNVLQGYLRPLPANKINELIARLQVICPEKDKGDIDRKFRAKIYIDELSKYPADIVMECLKKKYKWFPSLAELIDFCDDKMAFRELVKKGLR